MKLKKDRNCMGYPIYPNMGGMPMPLPMYPNMTEYYGNNNEYNDLNQIMNKLNNLEQRIATLEDMMNKNYTNNYNTTNYQMM